MLWGDILFSTAELLVPFHIAETVEHFVNRAPPKLPLPPSWGTTHLGGAGNASLFIPGVVTPPSVNVDKPQTTDAQAIQEVPQRIVQPLKDAYDVAIETQDKLESVGKDIEWAYQHKGTIALCVVGGIVGVYILAEVAIKHL
jgi:hypothetical protein